MPDMSTVQMLVSSAVIKVFASSACQGQPRDVRGKVILVVGNTMGTLESR